MAQLAPLVEGVCCICSEPLQHGEELVRMVCNNMRFCDEMTLHHVCVQQYLKKLGLHIQKRNGFDCPRQGCNGRVDRWSIIKASLSSAPVDDKKKKKAAAQSTAPALQQPKVRAARPVNLPPPPAPLPMPAAGAPAGKGKASLRDSGIPGAELIEESTKKRVRRRKAKGAAGTSGGGEAADAGAGGGRGADQDMHLSQLAQLQQGMTVEQYRALLGMYGSDSEEDEEWEGEGDEEEEESEEALPDASTQPPAPAAWAAASTSAAAQAPAGPAAAVAVPLLGGLVGTVAAPAPLLPAQAAPGMPYQVHGLAAPTAATMGSAPALSMLANHRLLVSPGMPPGAAVAAAGSALHALAPASAYMPGMPHMGMGMGAGVDTRVAGATYAPVAATHAVGAGTGAVGGGAVAVAGAGAGAEGAGVEDLDDLVALCLGES